MPMPEYSLANYVSVAAEGLPTRQTDRQQAHVIRIIVLGIPLY